MSSVRARCWPNASACSLKSQGWLTTQRLVHAEAKPVEKASWGISCRRWRTLPLHDLRNDTLIQPTLHSLQRSSNRSCRNRLASCASKPPQSVSSCCNRLTSAEKPLQEELARTAAKVQRLQGALDKMAAGRATETPPLPGQVDDAHPSAPASSSPSRDTVGSTNSPVEPLPPTPKPFCPPPTPHPPAENNDCAAGCVIT